MKGAIDERHFLWGDYLEMVKEADKAGFSRLYRELANAFFEELKKAGFSLFDIESGDGHFIIATGTDSVWQFRMKETPGWLYGLWLDFDHDDDRRLRLSFFGQYEDTIDKFRPSSSAYGAEMTYGEYGLEGVDKAIEEARFIEEHPYKAFSEDNCWEEDWGWKEDMTDAEAEEYYKAYLAEKEGGEAALRYCDEEMEKFVEYCLQDPLLRDSEFRDRCPIWPASEYRYRFVIKAKEGWEPGLWEIADDDDDNLIKKKIDELKAYAGKAKVSWESKYDYGVLSLAEGDDPAWYDRWEPPISRERILGWAKQKGLI